ncbi:unnamed protein product [Pleuronectes platessa]|uniref:Uncharacterized protein n=1 Tax=Pleuronectes platessa TaxID=8262 RepID=A0A9N7Z523_PLEPL|nr:unnamed protein product [Pleuronectes platessa]
MESLVFAPLSLQLHHQPLLADKLSFLRLCETSVEVVLLDARFFVAFAFFWGFQLGQRFFGLIQFLAKLEFPLLLRPEEWKSVLTGIFKAYIVRRVAFPESGPLHQSGLTSAIYYR